MRIGDLKKCSDCELELHRSCFSKNAARYDGLQHRCKKCMREYQQSRKRSSYQVRHYRRKYQGHDYVIECGKSIRKLSEQELQAVADHVACVRTARYMDIKRNKPIRLDVAA